MAKAKRKNITPTSTAPEHSPVIRECVIYAQSIAAYNAGIDTDATGNLDFGGAGSGQLGKACVDRASAALRKLNALKANGTPELTSKARVAAMILVRAEGSLEPDEDAFLRALVSEVASHLSSEAA